MMKPRFWSDWKPREWLRTEAIPVCQLPDLAASHPNEVPVKTSYGLLVPGREAEQV